MDCPAASMAIASRLADTAHDAPVAGTQVLAPTLLGANADVGRAEMEAVLSEGAEGFVLWIPPNQPQVVLEGGTKAESVVVAEAPSPAAAEAKAAVRQAAKLRRITARFLHVLVRTHRDGMFRAHSSLSAG